MKKALTIALCILLAQTLAYADVIGSQPIVKRTSCTAIIANGLGCYDTDDHTLCFGNGSTCVVGGGAGSVSAGVAGYFGYYPSNGTTIDDQTVLYTDGTNVGIGTTSPTSPYYGPMTFGIETGTVGGLTLTNAAVPLAETTFVLENNGYVEWEFFNDLGDGGSLWVNDSASDTGVDLSHMRGTTIQSSNYLTLQTWDGLGGIIFGTGGIASTNERMRIDSNGSVGVATTLPDKRLEVNLGTASAFRLTYNDSNGSAANYTDMTVSSGGDLTVAPSGGDTAITGTISSTSTITSSATGTLGWSVVAAANQACTTTCTSACMGGYDQGVLGVTLGSATDCASALSDQCYCAGAS